MRALGKLKLSASMLGTIITRHVSSIRATLRKTGARYGRARRSRRTDVPYFYHTFLFAAGLLFAFDAGYLATVFKDVEVGVRTAGGLLQLGGLGFVVWGLRDRGRSYRRLPFWKQIRKEASLLTGVPPTVELGGSGGATGGLEGTIVVIRKPPVTVEERLAALERQQRETDTAVTDLRTAQAEEIAERKKADEAEIKKRAAGDHELQEKIRNIEIGNIHLEWAGVCWVVIGTVCTTWPEELPNLLNRILTGVFA